MPVTSAAFTVAAVAVQVWMTVIYTSTLLSRQNDIQFHSTNHQQFSLKKSNDQVYDLWVNSSKTFQQMDGFGGSLTDSAAYLLVSQLDDKRNQLMKELFGLGENSIHLSVLRQPIGSTDFTATDYNFWSMDQSPNNQDDWNLDHFSMDREKWFVTPAIKLAMAQKNSKYPFKFFATPWSPPAWMREGRSMIGTKGGKLRGECYDTYARYFVRYLQEFKELYGQSIYGITVQNEPQYAPDHYPGLNFPPDSEWWFISNHLGPMLRKTAYNQTKIICFDHNFDDGGVNYPEQVLGSAAYEFTAGTSFHPYCYPCSHSRMTDVHFKFPAKDIWMLEAGSGTWIGDEMAQFHDQLKHMILSPRNWAKAVIFWNIALDNHGGPTVPGVGDTNRGFVTIQGNSYTRSTSYYSMGHTSKFVLPGAYRVSVNSYEDDLDAVAYINPSSDRPITNENTIVLVVANKKDQDKKVKVHWNQLAGQYAYFVVPAKAAVTFQWKYQ